MKLLLALWASPSRIAPVAGIQLGSGADENKINQKNFWKDMFSDKDNFSDSEPTCKEKQKLEAELNADDELLQETIKWKDGIMVIRKMSYDKEEELRKFETEFRKNREDWKKELKQMLDHIQAVLDSEDKEIATRLNQPIKEQNDMVQKIIEPVTDQTAKDQLKKELLKETTSRKLLNKAKRLLKGIWKIIGLGLWGITCFTVGVLGVLLGIAIFVLGLLQEVLTKLLFNEHSNFRNVDNNIFHIMVKLVEKKQVGGFFTAIKRFFGVGDTRSNDE